MRKLLVTVATVAVLAATAGSMSAQVLPPALPLPAPLRPGVPPTAAVQPIEGYAVEGVQGYEWRVKSAADGYAVVEGPSGYEVVGRGPAVPAVGDLVPVRLGPTGAVTVVAPADGY
jgi:hypothetical protein